MVAQIQGEDMMSERQPSRDRGPVGRRSKEAMQDDERRSGPLLGEGEVERHGRLGEDKHDNRGDHGACDGQIGRRTQRRPLKIASQEAR